MRIRHLNCGTLRPFGGRRVNGSRAPFLTARLVCHCLVVETAQRLVLVDTGFGLIDIARLRSWAPLRPRPKLDPTDTARRHLARKLRATFATRPRLDRDETAIRQVARLGYRPEDVSDIVLTHLDLDHAGGLPDFPRARVHVDEVERDVAMASHQSRYWRYQWAHRPDWITYNAEAGVNWFGFEGASVLQGLPEIALVPLRGHSAGHCGVAVRLDESAAQGGATWLLHAADAYFHHREVDPVTPHSTPGLSAFQKLLEVDPVARRKTRTRLRDLACRGEVELFCSHDPVELDRYSAE